MSSGFFGIIFFMKQYLILTNTTLPNILLPNEEEKYILTYYYLTEEQVLNKIKNITCRSFFGRKEVLNLFGIKEKIQVVQSKEYKIKPFDKILLKDEKGRFIIIELVPTVHYFKLLKRLKKI